MTDTSGRSNDGTPLQRIGVTVSHQETNLENRDVSQRVVSGSMELSAVEDGLTVSGEGRHGGPSANPS
ncbi:hypothetical protein CEXT_125141 [Caerostris extrusa]|uniref:Uncharacterized protein n=1 Tax=Caerostris extrusa TaxID=172846 RepID=A0AAV4S0F2_CAEEX|nr:hypothetical protein CEXT_125141 [Caerostris extrusa]